MGKLNSEMVMIGFGALVALLVRCCTMLHPHSGQGKPPMYGDYEAQRHWMEITVNLPVKEWYHNSSENDLMYWGLDYPPLTAYHSYLCGLTAKLINGSYVDLFYSRGVETLDHKTFMRYTVLLVDILLFFPAIFLYFKSAQKIYGTNEEDTRVKGVKKKMGTKSKILPILNISLSVTLALLFPGLILIDHGHFQYNCVSLGFAILATSFILTNRNILSTICFCLALNYKQMELYHALPFFMYLLNTCIPKPGQNSLSGLLKLLKLGITVIFMFAIIWLPFLFSLKDFVQVLHRLFPVARGVFEDKVANVWCALNVFYKFKTKFCNEEMLRYCTIVTLAAVLPSLTDVFLRPNVKKFVPSLINSSLAFFLFSFQVHEKSILLAAIPVILYLPNDPLVCFWFLFISNFSMLPLILKDGLVVAFLALTIFYTTTFVLSMKHTYKNYTGDDPVYKLYLDMFDLLVTGQKGKKHNARFFDILSKHFSKNYVCLKKLILYFGILASFVGCFCLFVASVFFKPPDNYPDLFPLLTSVYSCVHFVGFFIYFNIVQMLVPQTFAVPYIKTKIS